MSQVYSNTQIRLLVQTRSLPGVATIDVNTGEWPSFFKGSRTEIDLGVFDPFGVGVDLSNISELTLSVYPFVSTVNYLGYPLDGQYPAMFSVAVLEDDINPVVSVARWRAGLTQNATTVILPEQTANIDLQGQPHLKFTLCVSGLVNGAGNNRRIIYASGPCFIYESGITRA
jgi:hypothetical protein